MSASICGIDCSLCEQREHCKGCAETHGQPFGGSCTVAQCCIENGHDSCKSCGDVCRMREKLLSELNSLGIADMGEVTSLNALLGSYINCEYTLPNGQSVRLLRDDSIYLGAMLPKKNSDRCFGVAADESFLLVSELDADGNNAEIVVYKKRK